MEELKEMNKEEIGKKKNKIMKKIRNKLIYKNKGITLIALMITVIVLLILAGVTLNLTLGERGIFNLAKKAGENYINAQDKELAELDLIDGQIHGALGTKENGEEVKNPTTPEESETQEKTIDITANGKYDVKEYAWANVEIQTDAKYTEEQYEQYGNSRYNTGYDTGYADGIKNNQGEGTYWNKTTATFPTRRRFYDN